MRLVIVSNRLPVTITRRDQQTRIARSAGGLATGLDSFYKTYNSIWVGWPGSAGDSSDPDKRNISRILKKYNCQPVFLSSYDIELYYHGFCNKSIWPTFHYFTQYASYNNKQWEAYKRVNQHFASVIGRLVKKDDILWIHDYHLMLLPLYLRPRFPELPIGFFLHIPFPSSEIYRILPCRSELIQGLLAADLIGFHTHDYVRHFSEAARRLLGSEFSLGEIHTPQRLSRTDAFPMGIDFDNFYNAVDNDKITREAIKIKQRLRNRKIIISVDRLDYTKGIPERLEAFDYFLEKNAQYRGKVTLICVAVPSRTNVDSYIQLKKEVDQLISRINGKYGTIDWMPIWYLYRLLNFDNLLPLYQIADVALITPLRDGMNLIAKEYIASKNNLPGVLILSELAGAARELGEAITVNPFNIEEIARSIKKALEMPDAMKMQSIRSMQQRLKRYDITRWANDFLDRLKQTKNAQRSINTKKFSNESQKSVFDQCKKADKRLYLLDYDGTLTPLVNDPDQARPDRKLLNLLARLSEIPKNNIVIVSGRKRDMLIEWFKPVRVNLIAEHGIWIKKHGAEWHLIQQMSSNWKKDLRPTVEQYTDRTPGSFIEEKEYSIVWHYRQADPALAIIRARELKEALIHVTRNLNLGILDGNKVLEIKDMSVNKGRAVGEWLKNRKWDFIFAAGDDYTDEDIFDVLPKKAFSIKIGSGYTKARFIVDSPTDILKVLWRLTRC